MPRSLAWALVVDNVPPDEAAAFLETFKQYRVEKQHRSVYNVHVAGASYDGISTFELLITSVQNHLPICVLSDRTDQKHIKLTEAHKIYLREMAAQGLRPSRIRNSMPRKFGVDMETLPSLSKVQNFVNHYR
ncbi:hypothetical protein PF005_g26320 [Phytophthora fragariae]|uniref:Uncharacterized protein n=1 Tax=Phytophthora fragariae TaxID=53985 RepID=A0A6A3VTX5_9STRA|nr:hypothetical protein PF006_g24201 [Phytophthora fragariae]KAE9173331.1 hypothetical protein PF005_g26320 [Phytophthora fragariae]KAE9280024.1 hypothetical protein PF001_g24426 [Phytophthora fragariae]